MSAIQWLERHQILVYLGALVTGAAVGLILPGSASVFEAGIYPLLGALLYATFLQVPFTKLAEAFRDRRCCAHHRIHCRDGSADGRDLVRRRGRPDPEDPR